MKHRTGRAQAVTRDEFEGRTYLVRKGLVGQGAWLTTYSATTSSVNHCFNLITLLICVE